MALVVAWGPTIQHPGPVHDRCGASAAWQIAKALVHAEGISHGPLGFPQRGGPVVLVQVRVPKIRGPFWEPYC